MCQPISASVNQRISESDETAPGQIFRNSEVCELNVLRCNTSLRIKDECLIFTTAKICSNVNKLTRLKKKLPSTPTLKHRLNFTGHCEFFISVFSVSREGGREFHPFLRAALVQWDALLHVAKCFCSRQWLSNLLQHILFQYGFVVFLRFQVLLLHSWFSLPGFGLCEYSLCNRRRTMTFCIRGNQRGLAFLVMRRRTDTVWLFWKKRDMVFRFVT